MRLSELRPIGSEEQARPFARAQRRRRPGGEERRERAPRRGEHLERAQDPLAIRRRHARRGFGIARRKFGVELDRRAPLRLAAHVGAHRFGHGGHVGQAFGQRAKIEARAANEDDRPFADLAENLARRPRPSPDRKIDRAVDDAEQAMRQKPLLFKGRPRRQDPQVRVDLHRIRVDDRRAESFRELERRGRLAACRRARDEERASHSSRLASGSFMPSSVVATLITDPDQLRLSYARRRALLLREAGEGESKLEEGKSKFFPSTNPAFSKGCADPSRHLQLPSPASKEHRHRERSEAIQGERRAPYVLLDRHVRQRPSEKTGGSR